VRVLLARHLAEHPLEPPAHVELFEDLLLAGDVEVEVRADQVGELRRIVDALREHLQLVREARARCDSAMNCCASVRAIAVVSTDSRSPVSSIRHAADQERCSET